MSEEDKKSISKRQQKVKKSISKRLMDVKGINSRFPPPLLV